MSLDSGGHLYKLFLRELYARMSWASDPLGYFRGRQIFDGVFSNRHFILIKLDYQY